MVADIIPLSASCLCVWPMKYWAERLLLQWLGLSMAETRLNVRQYEQNLPDTVFKDVILITQRSLAKAALRPARGSLFFITTYIFLRSHCWLKALIVQHTLCIETWVTGGDWCLYLWALEMILLNIFYVASIWVSYYYYIHIIHRFDLIILSQITQMLCA